MTGITREQADLGDRIRTMMADNPARLLGLD